MIALTGQQFEICKELEDAFQPESVYTISVGISRSSNYTMNLGFDEIEEALSLLHLLCLVSSVENPKLYTQKIIGGGTGRDPIQVAFSEIETYVDTWSKEPFYFMNEQQKTWFREKAFVGAMRIQRRRGRPRAHYGEKRKRGRPRIYRNNAEKQRAYRKRKPDAKLLGQIPDSYENSAK